MKYLITLLTMAITITGLGQQMPYNPDANGDDFVGVDDVLGVLGVYDTALMQPDLSCDYEGTDLEQLLGGIIAGSLILDSMYVEYHLVDTVTTYLPECPDPVQIETVLLRSYMATNIYAQLSAINPNVDWGVSYLGFNRSGYIRFYPDDGKFRLTLLDNEIEYLTSYPKTTSWYPPNAQVTVPLPFPETWSLDEDGIHVSWVPESWADDNLMFRLIPFWHEAE